MAAPSVLVLTTQDVVRLVCMYQCGVYEDMRPLLQLESVWTSGGFWTRIWTRVATEHYLLGERRRAHAILSTWFECHAATRVSALMQCLPHAMPLVAEFAASSGRLDILDFVYAHARLQDCSRFLGVEAAMGGQIATMVYLCDRHYPVRAVLATIAAAAGNHVDILAYLHENVTRQNSFTGAAVDAAAAHGHLAALQWLVRMWIIPTNELPDRRAMLRLALDAVLRHGRHHTNMAAWLVGEMADDTLGIVHAVLAHQGPYHLVATLDAANVVTATLATFPVDTMDDITAMLAHVPSLADKGTVARRAAEHECLLFALTCPRSRAIFFRWLLFTWGITALDVHAVLGQTPQVWARLIQNVAIESALLLKSQGANEDVVVPKAFVRRLVVSPDYIPRPVMAWLLVCGPTTTEECVLEWVGQFGRCAAEQARVAHWVVQLADMHYDRRTLLGDLLVQLTSSTTRARVIPPLYAAWRALAAHDDREVHRMHVVCLQHGNKDLLASMPTIPDPYVLRAAQYYDLEVVQTIVDAATQSKPLHDRLCMADTVLHHALLTRGRRVKEVVDWVSHLWRDATTSDHFSRVLDGAWTWARPELVLDLAAPFAWSVPAFTALVHHVVVEALQLVWDEWYGLKGAALTPSSLVRFLNNNTRNRCNVLRWLSQTKVIDSHYAMLSTLVPGQACPLLLADVITLPHDSALTRHMKSHGVNMNKDSMVNDSSVITMRFLKLLAVGIPKLAHKWYLDIHGASPIDDIPHDLTSNLMADWLDKFVQDQTGGRVALMGHCLLQLGPRSCKPTATFRKMYATWTMMAEAQLCDEKERLKVDTTVQTMLGEMLYQATIAGRRKVTEWLVRRMKGVVLEPAIVRAVDAATAGGHFKIANNIRRLLHST
ncbi:Aste57867_23718 [Aphanomyces stellatus]|uniref:Aste57867_16067 protein n=1 Tax=Aphanomyces stellatus TaxID=120398 RepID=A0A485K8J0_9STRA|nr:hypothetical protein As57867_023646 [Aphanomyces stellatus]KAF0688351.1 hypothetical protein As57867_019949 [Aphanomyces stellatus]KAF0692694.1 hypothetical protein As57867_016190 [Aphanomyces stellatus]KAF0692904.1 hypothetical protein As57867_016011 [Aphanomyces stellatus]KAF0701189.1 hypothetical protein As57867_008267 [Aphanomyces stellatus]